MFTVVFLKKNVAAFRDNNTGLVVFTLSLTTLMSSIDTNIVNIGLPTIAKSLHTSFASVQWIVLGYLLAVTSLIVGVGRLGDIFGKKRLFLGGIGIFTLASLLCGLSPSIGVLITCRVLQGIGGAVIMALSFAIAGDLIPAVKLMQGMGILTATLPLGIALGPAVGGMLIAVFGWQSIFYLNMPIGVAALLLASRFPVISLPGKAERFDLPGVIVLAAIMVCYDFSVTISESQGLSYAVLILMLATAIGIMAFILIERNRSSPLIYLKMFGNRVFSASLAIGVVLYTVVTGANLILPFYFEQAKGFSSFETGLAMSIGPLGCVLFSVVAGWFAERFGSRVVMIFGMIAISLGAFFMSTISMTSGLVVFGIIFFFFNGSLAFFQTPNNTAIMSAAKPEQRGLVSGLLNLSRMVGQTTGASFMGALFNFFVVSAQRASGAPGTSPAAIAAGVHGTFLVAAALILLVAIIGAFTLKRRINVLQAEPLAETD